LERLEIDHPELHLALDVQSAPTAHARRQECLPDILDRFELGRVTIRKASVDVRRAGMHVVVPRANVSIHGKGEAMEVEVVTRGGSVDLPDRRVALASLDAQANVDLRGAGQLDLIRADLIGTGASAFLAGTMSDLCEPRIEAIANVRSDDLAAALAAYVPDAPRHVSGTGYFDARITVARGDAKAHGDVRLRGLQIEGFDPGDVNARFDVNRDRLKLDRLDVGVGKGQVAGTAELGFRQRLPLSTDLTLREVELAEVLRKLTLEHVWVLLRTAGKVQMKGTLLPLQLAGEANLDLNEFAVLDRAYDSRKGIPRKTLEFGRGHLSSAVSVDPAKVTVTGAQLEVGSSHMQIDGALYTDAQRGVDLSARSEDVSLDDLRGHVAELPWHGHTALTGRVHGPYADVAIEAAVSIRGFQILDVSLGDVSAQGEFSQNVLSFSDVRGRKDRSSYQGDFELDFGHEGIPVEARLELPEAYLHDLVGIAAGRAHGLSVLGDAANFDGQLSGTLEVTGPIARADAKATLSFASASPWHQRFDGGEARFHLRGHVPRLQFERLVLRRGEAELELSGGVGPDWRFDVDAKSRGFTLADVDATKAAQLRGALSVEGHLRGSAENPLVDLTARFTGARAGNAEVGV